MTLAGQRPLLLSSTLRDDNASLTCDLTNPDLYDSVGRIVLAHDVVHIRRSRFLWKQSCFERISVRSFAQKPCRLTLEIALAADFRDLFEVRGAERVRRGIIDEPWAGGDSLTLSYTGLDNTLRRTALYFDPVPDAISSSRVTFDLPLQPNKNHPIFIEICCGGEHSRRDTARRTFFSTARDVRRALRTASSRAASIETSSETFNEAISRSVSDLHMLITETPEGPYPYAGVPWFSTFFGRDAIVTALQTLWLEPDIARGVIRYLAAHQARVRDPVSDAEPGKILHESRQGEMAILGEVPFREYYGSIDATPLFVMLAGAYLQRTADAETVAALWPNIEAALDWISVFGDRDGDGFVEYFRESPKGLVNQGWKDSHDSIFHADGTLAAGPIALVEVQAYVYGAWRAASAMARALGRHDRAAEQTAKAERLRGNFDKAFFDPDLATYVLALDGNKMPCRVRSSNAGHALLTGIALPGRAPALVRTLMDSSSFCGWGVRTLASTEPRYNPMSYHNGSVWPHDNALLAAGLARYGFRAEAGRILEGLFAASLNLDLRRLPELFCGFPRQRSRGPTLYPVACAPQAWAAGALLSLFQSCLGLRFEPQERQVVFQRPYIPHFLDEVILRGLSVPAGRVDVSLTRVGEEVAVRVIRRAGDVQVLVVN